MWSAPSTPLCLQPTNPLLRPPHTGTPLFHWMGGRLKDVCIHVFDVSDDVGRFCKMVFCLCAFVLWVYETHITAAHLSVGINNLDHVAQSEFGPEVDAFSPVSLAVLDTLMWCWLLMDICHRVCRRHGGCGISEGVWVDGVCHMTSWSRVPQQNAELSADLSLWFIAAAVNMKSFTADQSMGIILGWKEHCQMLGVKEFFQNSPSVTFHLWDADISGYLFFLLCICCDKSLLIFSCVVFWIIPSENILFILYSLHLKSLLLTSENKEGKQVSAWTAPLLSVTSNTF